MPDEVEETRPLIKSSGQEILDAVGTGWEATEIRDLALSLLRLADSIDQGWKAPEPASIFRWPNVLTRIERNAVNLAFRAQRIYLNRRKRKKFIPDQFLSEPAWDILLDLFMQFAGGAKVSVTSLCIASDVPPTTALRYIAQLEKADFVKRSVSAYDKRVTFIELTDKGVLAVGQILETC